VHSASSRCAEASLVDGLAARFKALKELPLDLRAGLVHRLDKETSGLLLVAKNSSALATLSQLFLNRIIKKTYLAIVKGHPGRAGKVELPLGRHPHVRYKRMAHGLLPKEALTEYKVLQYFSSHAMLELQIKTGRTHQIRVHMASIGHPILGDFLYGQASHLITRQALHAQRLEFCFKGKVYSYEAGLPEDMQQLLGRCEEI
jgi:23S rRNA pseudouridine1911/1915/1917 synthase